MLPLFRVAFLGLLPCGAVAEAPLACVKAGMTGWAGWKAQLEDLNPGVTAFLIEGQERERTLLAYPCSGPVLQCPPDHVVAFYCAGNDMVLLAYEKGGCVSGASEVPLAEFESLLVHGNLCGPPIVAPEITPTPG
jgi:hypothetical protein